MRRFLLALAAMLYVLNFQVTLVAQQRGTHITQTKTLRYDGPVTSPSAGAVTVFIPDTGHP